MSYECLVCTFKFHKNAGCSHKFKLEIIYKIQVSVRIGKSVLNRFLKKEKEFK